MAESRVDQTLAEPPSSDGNQAHDSGKSRSSGGVVKVQSAVTATPTNWEDLIPGSRGFWYYQPHAHWIYQHKYSQIIVATLIGINFCCNMVEKQVDPQAQDAGMQTAFKNIDTFFNLAFAVELLLNMYSCWCWAFWTSHWNKFDFLVVVIGLSNTLELPFPPELALLRNMRAFRVFRLFKRVESLNRIVVALVKAVPGMVHACVIVVLVMFIYAICAVDLFSNHGRHCEEMGKGITSRGFCVGNEYFGTFGSAFYTLFQILIGDSWCEAIVRPLFDVADMPPNTGTDVEYIIIGVFFVSFVLINAFVLINVVVAVLLANMVPPPEEPKVELVEADCFDDVVEDVKTLRTAVNSMTKEAAGVSAELDREVQSTRDDVREVTVQFASMVQTLKRINFQPPPTPKHSL